MTKRIMIVSFILCALLLVEGASAMSSANFRMDWFTPLDGSSGESASADYEAYFTVGQVGNGVSAGPGDHACLGYWCSEYAVTYGVYLPLLSRGGP